MKNSEYVNQNAFIPNTHHGNLFTDGRGTMFSYGYHYPLLFKVNGLSFVNITGYSNTTSKHINYARQQAQHEVNIPYNMPDISPLAIQRYLVEERAELQEQIDNIRRKDTKKEARLQERVNEIEYTLAQLQATL